MNRLTSRTKKGIAYMAICDSLKAEDQMLEGSKPVLESLYSMFQKLADYEDTDEEFKNKTQALIIGEYVIEKCKKIGIKLEDFIDGDVIEYIREFPIN